ncbi:MAG: TetR/AcrR family transcriptional regulator [Clostridiales bacterium]
MSQINSRKAKRIERIRGEIMDAAVKIIGKKGFKNTTTKEIAAKADMAEGTLYNYFKNKEDILLSIAERYISYKRNDFIPVENVISMEDFILKVFKSNASNVAKEHPLEREVLKALLPEFLTDKTLGEMYYNRIVKRFLEQIEKSLIPLVEKGVARDIDVRIMSRILYSSFIGFAILELNSDEFIIGADNPVRAKVSKAYIDILGRGMSQN